MSLPNRTRGQTARAYRRGWNDALRMLLFVLNDEYGEEEPLTKRSIARSCRKIRFRLHQVRAKINQELAAFYGCSRRTIQYWRSQGAPLERGGVAMLRWLARRPHLPKGTEERFAERLEMQRIRVGVDRLQADTEAPWVS